MKSLKIMASVLVLAGTGTLALGQGVILWDESVNGELSQGLTPPTSLSPVRPGTNSVIGATESVPFAYGWITYGDEFLLTVPAGLAISAVYFTTDQPNVWAWIGDSSYSTRLGWVQNPTNGELLAQWSLASIPAGTYGMYMENHNEGPVASVADYRLDFVTEPAPEPGAVALLLFGLGGWVALGRRFRNRPEA
jgi:hypothetical protein